MVNSYSGELSVVLDNLSSPVRPRPSWATRADKVLTVDSAKTALVVVDMQNGFVTENSRPVVPVIADLVERWTAAG